MDIDRILSNCDDMESTQQERRVARFERRDDDGHLLQVINTAYVIDAQPPYETAVSDLHYNRGCWVVTQCYDSSPDALVGHREWIKKMTDEELPAELIEVSGFDLISLKDKIEENKEWRTKPRHDPLSSGTVSYMWLDQKVKTNVQSEEY